MKQYLVFRIGEMFANPAAVIAQCNTYRDAAEHLLQDFKEQCIYYGLWGQEVEEQLPTPEEFISSNIDDKNLPFISDDALFVTKDYACLYDGSAEISWYIECIEQKNNIVYICSKYSGNIEYNVKMAKKYGRYAVDHGYVPLAPHLLLPQYISEETDRDLAIEMDLQFLGTCSEIWVCGDEISSGMAREIKRAEELGMPIKYVKESDLNDKENQSNS